LEKPAGCAFFTKTLNSFFFWTLLVREAFCSQIIHIVEEREASARNQKERERLRSKRAAVWYHFHSLILQFIHRSRLKEEEEDRKRLKLERKKALGKL
jgi:hypothetical protein